MKRILGIAIGGIFLMSAAGSFAQTTTTTIPPDKCFNGDTDSTNGCSSPVCAPGSTTCSADDSGCVSGNKTNAKCAKGVGGAFAKLVPAIIKCHAKQADTRFKQGATPDVAGAGNAEETCEDAAIAKLDATLAKVTPGCPGVYASNAALERLVLVGEPAPVPSLSLDGGAGGPPIYCDSTAGAQFIEDTICQGGPNNGTRGCTSDADCGGGSAKCRRDDVGWVPKTKDNLKCEDTEGKELGKLVAAVIKCHQKMDAAFAKAKPFDEEACEENDPVKHKSALEKYNAARDKTIAKGICPACNDQAHWDGEAANAIGTVDGANNIAYPCNPS